MVAIFIISNNLLHLDQTVSVAACTNADALINIAIHARSFTILANERQIYSIIYNEKEYKNLEE